MGPKVVTGFAYINEGSEDEIDREEDAPTFVTHSRRVMRLYNLAMEALAEDDSDRALSDFNEALNYPQSLEVRRNSPPEGDPLHGLLNICQAALKWKGELLIDKNPLEAFECLKEAYEIHPTDIVLCKKLGKLALEVGFVKFAQWILEEGLNQRPDHIPLMEPLIEVYLERQDYERACEISELILDHLPHHQRAFEVLKIHHQGHELLTPKFIRRVDHEPKRQNSIRRFIPSFSWTDFLSTLIEIIECSKLHDEETGTSGILLESMNNDWEMVCQAKIKVKIIHRSPEGLMDIDHRTPEHRTETQKPGLEDEGPSRFPLRSRLSHPKTEEVKTWDIIESFKSALGEDHWNSLFQDWNSETKRVRRSSPVHVEDYTGISHFLSKTVISEDVLSPLDLAIEMMEFKGQNPVLQLEDEEAELLCTLDKLLTFDCSPDFHLFMAELLLDAAYISQCTGLGESESSKTSKDDKALIRSQKHIFKCIEHNSSQSMKTGSELHSNEAYSLRLYWTLGRIQLLQGRCQEAEKSFTSALQFSAMIEDWTLDLNHVKNDGLISKQSIESKLIMCLYQDIIQGLETEDEESCYSQQDEYQDICNLLIPVLFSEKTKQDCPVLMRSWKYKGLIFLKEMAKLRNDVETEFRCHLHLVDLVLDSENYLDLNSSQNRSAQSSQFPESLKNSIQCLPKRETFLQILRFVTFVFEKWSSASLAVHQSMVFPFLDQDQCQKLIRRITVKSLLHLEWCFWRFHFNESETNTSKSSNKNELRKRAFHEASAFLFICTQMESAIGKNAEIMENISVFLYEILMEREAVCLKKTAEVKNIALHLMSLRFASWIDYLSTMEETDQESLSPLDRLLMEVNIEEKDDIKHSVEVLIDGVAHFVKCLFGVDFATTVDASWGSKALPRTGSKENLKRSNLSTIWRYLAPCLSYYESKEGDLHIFNKLTEVLQQLIKAIGRPPEDLLQQLSLDEIFIPGVCNLDQELDQGLVPLPIQSNLENLDGILKQLEHREVHEEVYYYLCLAQLDIDLEFGQGDDNITGQNGIQIFEDQIKWIKMDLRFNPDRYWSWECLAINYKQATETLVESCIRELLPGEFETKTELVQKLNTFLQCQKRCFQIAGNLAKGEEYKDEKQYVHEMLAELEFFKTARTPPFQYPPLSSCQLNPTQQDAYLSAKSWLTGVLHSSTKPKWHVHYYLGKTSWKLKGLGWEHEALMYFSKAHEIAQKTEGGLIEPFYKLHCTRLKLLLNGYKDWEGLSKFDFEEQNFQESAKDWHRVFGDCRSALEFCRSKISAFHRVYYQLAQAFCAQGNHMGALSYLQQLFVKGKKKFCIAFGPVDPRQCRVSQKASSGQSQSRTGMQNSPVLVKIAGAGINESIWKFTSAVRKYLVFYLRLLYLTRDIEMISLVSTVLTKGDFDAPKELMSEGTGQYKYPCLADMPVRAHGVKLLLLHNGLKKEIGIETANQLNASMERILEIASSPVITGSEYSALSQNISQLLVHTWQIIESITDFDTLLFSASMELFCDEKCSLISSSRSLEALTLMIPEFQNEETESSIILSELSCYAEIYSILVLRSQDINLASAMTGVLQQRLSLMKDPSGRRLFLRGLFCIIQVLFQRAERIQNQSMEASTTDPDTLINQLMHQVSFVIKHFNEMLMEMRFLSLRLMHVMQHLYEGVCLMNGVETSLVVQPQVPLKSLVQIWMSEMQKVRSRPPLENVCIDLTQEEEQMRSSPDLEMMETEERAPMVQVQEKEVVMEGTVVQKQEVEEETRTGEVVQFGGAFASAFQQCMDFKEDETTDKSDSFSPNN